MKFNIQYKIAFLFVLGGLNFAVAQKKNENIGTEVVNVVKPYTPTISDAFKVKESPVLEDDENTKKEVIQYNIFSFPVASTFTPSKGKAANVDKTPQEKIFKNYATLGIGNYFNANAELYVTEEVGDNGYVGGMLRHFSSQGGIKDLVLDDKFMDNAIDLTYGSKQSGFSWTADLGYQNQVYNWYGIYQDYFAPVPGSFYDNIDPKHTYNNLYVGGRIDVSDSFFKDASLKFNHFSDSFGSSENRFYIKPSFDFDISETKIKTDFVVDYLGGSFDRNYTDTAAINYGFTNFGIHPSFVINKEDWSINVGAAAFYSLDTEHSDNKFFVYPEINASLKVVGDLMVFYLGAEGGLDQNSYRDFTNINPFLSPTLNIAPTDRQYDLFAGLKGKLAGNVSYNVRASYMSEKNKALFRNNAFPSALLAELEGYEYGNSFGVVYDNVKTFSFFGELKADFSKNVSFGVNATFNAYTSDVEQEAWNLPTLKIGSSLDVNITKKWYAGADVFFVGDRKDFRDFSSVSGVNEIVTLDSYFDANAHVGYKYNERLTGFLKFNNIANQGYEKWLNYQVQKFQVMLGASYKFDF